MAKPRTKYLFDIPCEHCGAPVKPQLRWRKGKFNGWWQAQRFCSRVCTNRARPKKLKIDNAGYVYTYRPGSTKRSRIQVYEHRVVMEGIIGRPLAKHETVHHKNGDRTDNRPENLELWTSRHPRGQRVKDIPVFTRMDTFQSNNILGMMSMGG